MLDVPEHRPRGSRVKEAAQGATDPGRGRAPVDERGVGHLQRVQTLPPGQHVVHADQMSVATSIDDHATRRRVGVVAVGAWDAPRDGQRQRRIDPGGVQDRQRLHVQRRRLLRGVGEFHHGDRDGVLVEQEERLVAFTPEIPGGRRTHGEAGSGDRQGRRFVEIGPRGRQDRVEVGRRGHAGLPVDVSMWR